MSEAEVADWLMTPAAIRARCEKILELGVEGRLDHFEVHLENGSIYGPDNVDPSPWLAENASKPSRSV